MPDNVPCPPASLKPGHQPASYAQARTASTLGAARSAEDVAIGMALTTFRMLATGRRLSQRPLLHNLPTDELLDFWADDQADLADRPTVTTHLLFLATASGHGAVLTAALIAVALLIGAAVAIILVSLTSKEDRVAAIGAIADVLRALLPWHSLWAGARERRRAGRAKRTPPPAQ